MYVIKLNRLIAVVAGLLTVAVVAAMLHKTVPASVSVSEGVRVPILMYHIILKNSNGNKYTVSPSDFEKDLKFLDEHGYTTVFMQDLIDYVYDGTPLPEKPVVLTFDDGYYNNYYYIYPLLKQYQAKAVISVVGTYTDQYSETVDTNVNYAHLSWDNLREMTESDLVEIQNHTYNLHSLENGRKGCQKNQNESSEKYAELLIKDLDKLQNECLEQLGNAPTTFTYPYGFISEESLDIVKSLGFKASLSCEEGMNELERNQEQLYKMKRYIRTPEISAADILRN